MIISIVGNKPPNYDASVRIESADTVVRISKMNWLDSGLAGHRTDVLYLEPNIFWWFYSPQSRRQSQLCSIPEVHIRNSWWERVGQRLLDEGILTRGQVHVIPSDAEKKLPGCTTFGMAVYDLHRRFPHAVLLGAGSDFGEKRARFFTKHVHGGEVPFMDKLIEQGILVPI
ncbi:hypothetical protein [Akkermansia sp.]|uniref:hypothetical protein n=1 Tax=Akkermansia sp. TaxID=1872421 RepID=UPI003AB74171